MKRLSFTFTEVADMDAFIKFLNKKRTLILLNHVITYNPLGEYYNLFIDIKNSQLEAFNTIMREWYELMHLDDTWRI